MKIILASLAALLLNSTAFADELSTKEVKIDFSAPEVSVDMKLKHKALLVLPAGKVYVRVEDSYLATCGFEMIKESKKKTEVLVDFDAAIDDGYNGCKVRVSQNGLTTLVDLNIYVSD